jgi:hypothetical protein
MKNPETRAPGSEPNLTASASPMPALRAELDRLGVSYSRASAGTYVALHDLGDEVLLKGPPLSGLSWQGAPDDALARLRALPSDVDPPAFWEVLGGGR